MLSQLTAGKRLEQSARAAVGGRGRVGRRKESQPRGQRERRDGWQEQCRTLPRSAGLLPLSAACRTEGEVRDA